MIVTVTLNPCVDRTLEVPGFQVGQHARARLLALVPAGKGVNVARGVAKLGRAVCACVVVGKAEARAFRESLRRDGIECAMWPVGGETRVNTTILDPVNHTTTHLREEGFVIGPRELAAVRERLLDFAARGLHRDHSARLVFAGSLPPGLEPDHFAGLLQDCRRLGATLIVDTSGAALRAAVETGCVDTIKPNLLELGECLGRDVGPRDGPDAASELLDRVGRVLLTLGAGGAWVLEGGLRVGMKCPVPSDELRNTVGCGDAFLAGWLHGWTRPGKERMALRWGLAAAAACARSETTVDYRAGDVRAMLGRCEPI